MKYDLTKKRTKSAERVLSAFSKGLLDCLKKNALEDMRLRT